MNADLSGMRRTYMIGFGVIAVLLILSQAAIHSLRSGQEAAFTTINQAGLQRAYSQRLAHFAWALADGRAQRSELVRARSEFLRGHERLKALESNSAAIQTQFRDLEPTLAELDDAVGRMLNQPEGDLVAYRETARSVADAADRFLPRMNAIVLTYENQNRADYLFFDKVAVILGAFLVLTLAFEFFFVFEPMMKAFRRRLGDLKRTRKEAQQAAAELKASEARYAIAVAGSQDALWDWDLVHQRIYLAPHWCELLGLKPEDVSDDPQEWFSRIEPENLGRFRTLLAQHIEGKTERIDFPLDMIHADGTQRSVLCRARAIRDDNGRAVRLAGSLADITELRRVQEELRSIALHDQLTGLPNRQLFTDRLRESVSRSRRESDHNLAVLFFDFDRFKIVNDSLGHDVGDLLLLSIAERFRSEIRECDLAARFGGDEFVLLLDGIEGRDEATKTCERLLDVFARPHALEGHEVVSTASIGVYCDAIGERSAEDLIRDADAAMYRAKSLGKARYQVFDEDMRAEAVNRLRREQELRIAIRRDEFQIDFQPIIETSTGRTAGFEALVRWDHPQLGRISPDQFLAIAEETGLIIEIGETILRTCCQQLAAWRREGIADENFFVNVNLSRRQLVHPALLESLVREVAEAGIEAKSIKFEVTETVVMDERTNMIPTMEAIRALGHPLAIDDFGTGYSSLSCLHQFPIDALKIDRSFTVNMETQREFAAVMHAIITLAHHLQLAVVVEGVETPAQLAQLQAMDCEFGQGYLFSKPLKTKDATELLEVQRARETEEASELV